jgi:ADP-heptose:LPS heptosyltransferase
MAGRFEQWMKDLGHRWLRHTAPAAGPPPATADLEKISRILVVRLDHRLGNIVLLTGLLVGLKGRFSRAQVSCLLARSYWDMREFIPSVDEFIPFEHAAMASNPLRIRPLLKRLKERHFDLVFDASDDRTVSFNHLVVTALSGGRFRVGHDRGEAARYYEVAVPVPDPTGGQTRNAAEMHLDLLRAVTPIRSTPRPLLKPPKTDSGFAGTFRERNGISADAPIVVLHPGARGNKRWPAPQFADVVRQLKTKEDIAVAMIWGPADVEAAAEVKSLAGDAVQPAGILSFADLISLLRDAVVFLSSDCGPMHFAAALGTPVVSVFLVSDAGKYGTLGPDDIVFDGRVETPTPDRVAEAVRRILSLHRQGLDHSRASAKVRLESAGKDPQT